MDSVMLLPAEKENGHVNPSRITMVLSRLQFGAKMNVLMGLMLLLSLGGALFNALSAQGKIMQGGSILCWLFNQRIVVPDNCHPSLLFLACFSGSVRRNHSVLLCSEQTV